MNTMPVEPAQLGGLTRDQLQQHMQNRELIAPGNILAILQEEIKRAPTNAKVLIDGFPRDLESAKLWDEKFGPPEQVLFFDCKKEEAKQRFLSRSRDAGDDEAVFEKEVC